nr:aphrodisin-like isoform X2 [Peromyscus maniculatus bairdii]
MKILLLTAVIGFVGTEEFLEKYQTLYLAADDLKLIEENGPLRIHVRHILQHNNYDEVSITFYIRQKEGCQLYTLLLRTFITFIVRPSCDYLMLSDKSRSLQNQRLGEDAYVTGFWMFPDTFSTLPESWLQNEKNGTRVSGVLLFELYPVSNTTVIMRINFVEKNGKNGNLCVAFSKEASLTKELWDIYVKISAAHGIPRENIQDILKNGTCPQGTYGFGFKIDKTCYISVHGI